jgi:hypothetical protein
LASGISSYRRRLRFHDHIEASGKCSHGLINLPLAERDREAVQAAPPASRMCTGGAQKRWKINTIDATDDLADDLASPVDAVVFEHRGAFSGP